MTPRMLPFDASSCEDRARKVGLEVAETLRREKAILGVFDEGCMGMFNAIIPDSLLNPLGIFKERLSQSALYFETQQVSAREAQQVRDWLDQQGMRFHIGDNHGSDLTDAQSWISVACTSRRYASPMTSAATQLVFSISRG
ncbi:MAG: hypothetical protein R3C56_28135 [Pirellulaceae bacterium]